MSFLPYWVDLHLHTVLSPCGELEMGAPEIVAAYRDAGISLCAVTDHNDIANAPAIREAAAGDPVVITGIEVQSVEDIHVVVLFPDDSVAKSYREWLWREMPQIENDPDVFGYQLVIDRDNNILDERETLLVQGSGYSVDDVALEACERGALVILAHLDRPSFSYEAVLGRVPDDFPCHALELSPAVSHAAFEEYWKERYPDRLFIRSSDSHRLSTISKDRCTVMMLQAPSFAEVELALKGLEGREVLCPWVGAP
ncbi:MAG: PHP domain-containing protein [Synergistaceae bacterium]|nr:histidinol-phosphatase [Synergistota bacterium]NLM71225.1 PHP domain-containing protein [Synergistaceae bacterium]